MTAPSRLRQWLHSWAIWAEYFRRARRDRPRRSMTECLRMAACARAVINGPPCRLRWMERWERSR
jgi:hypothetical protein